VRDGLAADASSIWEAAIEALEGAKRDTDVVGWLEWRAALGLIRPTIFASEMASVRALTTRVRRELAQRLDPDTLGLISVRVHVHPASTRAGRKGRWPADAGCGRATTDDRLKRGLDVAGGVALLILLSPLFVLIAVLVKVSSPGPVLFRQVRVGQMMKPFTMLKFRTMHVNADEGPHHQFVSRFITGSAHGADLGTNGLFKLSDDPRITSLGRFLRKTSLDELPQLWNVLRGEMSLVGPRPPLPYELEQYKRWHRRRVVEAKPGLTGLWQVTGRSRTTFDEMVRLDLRYARMRSLSTDLKILLATPAAVISGKGAC